MKIIALLPFKNEAWVLPSYLSSVSKIADEIIALDDNSTDEGAEILKSAGATVVPYIQPAEETVINVSARRRKLLELGRQRGGTHFIWLDADETFSSNFIANARETILSLQPGEKITMRWVQLWKSTHSYIDDERSPFGIIWKDFIVCDHQDHYFKDVIPDGPRTPGQAIKELRLPDTEGVVLHFQFVEWDKLQLKQAWYRCSEYLKKERSAMRINHTYSITLDDDNLKVSELPANWSSAIILPAARQDIDWRLKEMLKWFDQYGIKHFEPLQIWHIPQLREEFVRQVGREPKPAIAPRWLLALNTIRKKLKESRS